MTTTTTSFTEITLNTMTVIKTERLTHTICFWTKYYCIIWRENIRICFSVFFSLSLSHIFDIVFSYVYTTIVERLIFCRYQHHVILCSDGIKTGIFNLHMVAVVVGFLLLIISHCVVSQP